MEDILASIRRIIAEDQSNNLGRSGLGGLTRRSPPAQPSTQAADAVAPAAPVAEPSPAAGHDEVEPAIPASAQADALAHAYEAPVYATEPFAAGHEAAEPALPDARFVASDPVPELAAPPPVWEPAADLPVAAPDEPEPLMSPSAGASITSSFQSLAESVVLQDPDLIERVMRDAMRPLLKAWLDDHLPSIVERLVRSEIERVARGGRARTAQ